MRSLCLLSATTSLLLAGCESNAITATAIDLDHDVLFAASESISEADVNVQVWTIDKQNLLKPFCGCITPLVEGVIGQIILFTVIADSHSICLIMRSGDIAVLSLNSGDSDSPHQLDIVGTITPGYVLAASLSPDSSLLAIVTSPSEPTLILMDTTSFDVISSYPIKTSEYGEETPVNVGWGSKATQFHGSLGKTAAHAHAVSVASTTTSDDDTFPRISWRGDAQFFAISVLQDKKRVIRVYNRVGSLQSTTEDVPGLEHVLSWRPSGGLIAGTQRFGSAEGLGKGREGRHDVVFFERNGLRHGEFTLRERPTDAHRVRELAWNADSAILSVWLERDDRDVVQLWTIGNYHWYLKFEVPADLRFSNVLWHPEDAGRLILASQSSVTDTRYIFYTSGSSTGPPNDTGLVAVVDGEDILLTPFRTQNVPPPMASYKLALSGPSSLNPNPPPMHIAFTTAPVSDVMTTLFADGTVAVWDVRTTVQPGKGMFNVISTKLMWRDHVGDTLRARQVFATQIENNWIVGVLGTDPKSFNDTVSVVLLSEAASGIVPIRRWNITLPGRNGRFIENSGSELSVTWQGKDSTLWQVPLMENDLLPKHIASFPEFCAHATQATLPESRSKIFVGLSGSRLFVVFDNNTLSESLNPSISASTTPLTISQTCTSYAIGGSFLVWTVTSPAHEAVFAKLETLRNVFRNITSFSLDSLEKRRVERGARIVTVVPSTMSLVLQMPRGNLETVMPRPLVMEQVLINIQRGDYRSAFLACRKHRVDLNILVESNPTVFAQNISSFVEQLDDVDHINLFLSGLGRSSLSPETINELCDGIRVELESRNIKKFVNSILTAHVVKTPPDYEAGLLLLLRLRDTESDLVEDALKYIIFLVDTDRLFDTALGMYDFSLVLLVAQHSQKDPQEYLPFLRSLRTLEGPYRHFKIDNHLKRYRKALHGLYNAGGQYFEEAKAYVEKHKLYMDALELWKTGEKAYNAILEMYGDYLFDRREFHAAGLAFVHASCIRKAMVAYEKSLDWQELFDLVVREGIIGEDLITVARRVAEDLGSKQRHSEAARVLLDYADDVDEAVSSLVRGNAWSEARRITTLRKRDDLVTPVILQGALEARSSISDEVAEIQDLLDKQTSRLDELAARKLAQPDVFYGIEDSNLANVDVMTDVSNPGTMFTRYTVAPTASDRSKRTSRSKRKLDRKAGRKGTAEEEEYLLKSLAKLVSRLSVVQAETRALLPHLLVSGGEYTREGRELQKEVEDLEQATRRNIERVWKEREQTAPSSENTLPIVPGNIPLTDKVPRPVVSDVPWKVGWIETVMT